MNGFKRTVCACDECKACCKRQAGPLILEDLQRIADYLGVTVDQAKRLFKASRGSVVGLRGGPVVRIGTITPKQHEDGRCIFLDEKDRCSIHPVSPFGCSYFDVHMDKDEATRRVKWAISQHCKPEYQKLREELK